MRRRLFPLVLLLLVVVATVVAIEVGARVAGRFACVGAGYYHVQGDPRFGWMHVPGATYTVKGCLGREFEFHQTVRINSLGLRDGEHPYDRVAGRLRVLVLGDSVVEAAQVAPQEPWTEVLEGLFAAAGSGEATRDAGASGAENAALLRAPVDVLNTGHAGYTTHNQALFYEHEGRRYGADLVLSQFNVQNDVAETSASIYARMYQGAKAPPPPSLSVDGNGRLVVDPGPYERFAEERRRAEASPLRYERLRRNLYLLRFVERLAAKVQGAGEAADKAVAPLLSSGPYGVFAAQPTAEWEDAWALVEAGYRRMRDAARADGARFAVVLMPAREEVDPKAWALLGMALPELARGQWDLDGPRRRMRAFLEREGIEYLDLTPAMKAAFARTGRHGFFALDPHPTAEGHQTIGEALLPFVRERLKDVQPPR